MKSAGVLSGAGVSHIDWEDESRGKQGSRFPLETLPSDFLGYKRIASVPLGPDS